MLSKIFEPYAGSGFGIAFRVNRDGVAAAEGLLQDGGRLVPQGERIGGFSGSRHHGRRRGIVVAGIHVGCGVL